MMSAEYFSRQRDVWRRLTPACENHVRWINRNLRAFGVGVMQMSDPRRRALLSEVAFNRAGSTSTDAESAARAVVQVLPRGESAEGPLDALEKLEIEQLRNQLADYTRSEIGESAAIFKPRFPGCGLVDAATGDILRGTELIEVKMVERSFRSDDVRQALTYCALAYEAQQPVGTVTLLNPRRGHYFSQETGQLALDLGANSWVELMMDIADAMTGGAVSL